MVDSESIPDSLCRLVSYIYNVRSADAVREYSTVMYVNLWGNSTSFQTLAMLQGLYAYASAVSGTDIRADRGPRSEVRSIHQIASARDICSPDGGIYCWIYLQLHEYVLLSGPFSLDVDLTCTP